MAIRVKCAQNEREVCNLLGLNSEPAGGPDWPDISRGAIVVRRDDPTATTRKEVQAILDQNWTQDLPIILVSKAGFEPDAADLVAEYEEAHIFQPPATPQSVA